MSGAIAGSNVVRELNRYQKRVQPKKRFCSPEVLGFMEFGYWRRLEDYATSRGDSGDLFGCLAGSCSKSGLLKNTMHFTVKTLEI